MKRNPRFMIPSLAYGLFLLVITSGYVFYVYHYRTANAFLTEFVYYGLIILATGYYQSGIYELARRFLYEESVRIRSFFSYSQKHLLDIILINLFIYVIEGIFELFEHHFVFNISVNLLLDIIFSFVAISIVLDDTSFIKGFQNGLKAIVPGFLQSFWGTLMLGVVSGLLIAVGFTLFPLLGIFITLILTWFVLGLFPIWMFIIYDDIQKKKIG